MKLYNREELQNLVPKLRGHFLSAVHWWVSELWGALPKAIRHHILGDAAKLTVTVSQDQALLEASGEDGVIEVDRVSSSSCDDIVYPPLKGSALVFISPEEALFGQMKVPDTVQTRLRQILALEIERHNPFRAQKIFFDFVVRGTDAQNNLLEVNWALVPDAVVQRAFHAARCLGYYPEAVGLPDENQKALQYVFVRQRRPVSIRFGRALVVLLCSVLFLGSVLGGIVVARKQRTNEFLEATTSLKAEAEAAQTIKSQVEKKESALVAISEKIKEPRIIDVMLEATKALPDNTWVVSFDIDGKELRLKGMSVTASSLIEKLSAVPLFVEPHFNAAITLKPAFGEKSAFEQFDIATSIRGRTDTKKGSE